MRHFTPRRAWAPLTDAEWAALAPHVARLPGADGRSPGGRPIGAGPRQRMDAILHAAVSGAAWRALPAGFGKGATVARHFRRLAHAGLWSRLLRALAARDAPPVLKGLEYWLCRAARRAMRLLGLAGLELAQRLGLLTALPQLPWFLPDPALSAALFRLADRVLAALPERWPPPGLLSRLGRCLAIAGGRSVWSRRFAPA